MVASFVGARRIGGALSLFLVLVVGPTATDGSAAEGELVRAALNGSTGLVRELLDKGANIEETDSRDTTALIASARNGFIDVMRIVLDPGANVHHESRMSYTALTFAAFGGHADVVELLLEHRARVDVRASSGITPLLAAASAGDVRTLVLDCLRQRGDSPLPDKKPGRLRLPQAGPADKRELEL